MSEKDFILHPERWPKWPILPMKHKDGRVGIIVAAKDYLSTVFLINIWELGEVARTIRDLTNPNIPREQYSSVDEMLAAGWKVD